MKQDIVSFLLTVVLAWGSLNVALGQQAVHVVILGDSNTWLGGDDCTKPKGWNTWFREQFKPASCRSYARSGATWTNTSATKRNTTENTDRLGDDNVVYNQICRLEEAVKQGQQPSPQLILIAAGTNDAWFLLQRPSALEQSATQAFANAGQSVTGRKPSEVLTLAGSVRYGCEWLEQLFPSAQIILLTPMQTTAVPTSRIRQAGDIIEQCGHLMGLGVIRQDQLSSVSRARESRQHRFTYDGTHTSEEGARRNGVLIANQVRAMMQY